MRSGGSAQLCLVCAVRGSSEKFRIRIVVNCCDQTRFTRTCLSDSCREWSQCEVRCLLGGVDSLITTEVAVKVLYHTGSTLLLHSHKQAIGMARDVSNRHTARGQQSSQTLNNTHWQRDSATAHNSCAIILVLLTARHERYADK